MRAQEAAVAMIAVGMATVEMTAAPITITTKSARSVLNCEVRDAMTMLTIVARDSNA